VITPGTSRTAQVSVGLVTLPDDPEEDDFIAAFRRLHPGPKRTTSMDDFDNRTKFFIFSGPLNENWMYSPSRVKLIL